MHTNTNLREKYEKSNIKSDITLETAEQNSIKF